MSTKHTPGPWAIADDHAVAIIDGAENLYFHVGPALVDATPLDDPECEANARLIAQAPAMYAALETAQAFLNSIPGLKIYEGHTVALRAIDAAKVALRAIDAALAAVEEMPMPE